MTLWTVPRQASLYFTISCSSFKLMSMGSVMPSNHLSFCHSLLPSVFPSIRVFSNKSTLCIRRPKYWSFNFSISPSKEYSGLISSRTNWFDLLAVQGMLKSLLKHHSSNTLILWNPPAMWETWVQSLSWEDLLEKGMATHSSILAWSIPWREEPSRLQSTGSQRVGYD